MGKPRPIKWRSGPYWRNLQRSGPLKIATNCCSSSGLTAVVSLDRTIGYHLRLRLSPPSPSILFLCDVHCSVKPWSMSWCRVANCILQQCHYTHDTYGSLLIAVLVVLGPMAVEVRRDLITWPPSVLPEPITNSKTRKWSTSCAWGDAETKLPSSIPIYDN
ncbi:hypothetical protein BGZ63DRAFT_81931 [Mariannaea sp. PMI_226]|nr:hypothetical protein BGZ63DRAFT_81931 [Mariannaea sp. PMI_226]